MSDSDLRTPHALAVGVCQSNPEPLNVSLVGRPIGELGFKGFTIFALFIEIKEKRIRGVNDSIRK